MGLKEEIKSFINEQKFIAPRLAALDKSLTKLEKDIKKYIIKAWDKTKEKTELIVYAASGGSHCTGFKMDAFISIIGYDIDGKSWVKNEYYQNVYLPPAPPLKFLQDFAKRMTKELGIPVQENQGRRLTQKRKKEQVKLRTERDGVRDFEDANVLFDNDLVLIKEGHVWYKGWDISDPFLFCQRKSNGHLILWYATNGHGWGFDVQAENPTEKELDDFINHVEQDQDNIYVRPMIDRIKKEKKN
jgi:hypothetical protein